ncbi:hypothetical protein CL617_05855 [archaeon]|nr:hypothetical protein [archaeon]|tara:strand:+ start:16668 stop:17519 length:852 start_codon:yes stop_codon:yes gene_type:complete
MVNVLDYFDFLGNVVPALRTIIVAVLVFVIFNFIFNRVKNSLLKIAKTKKQISNVEIFSRLLKYVLILIVVIFAIFSYSGSLTGLGIGIGLFSAALGWALQKPITGIAGWIMVVTKRPFEIGDRIIIGDVRGDVKDISLTHIYLREIGGIVQGEENSGRIIMVPNSKLFEQDITNYTLQDEYVLDQVSVTITYESNLDNAMKVILQATKRVLDKYVQGSKKEPYIRTFFRADGVDVRVRYFTPAHNLQEINSYITQEILKIIHKNKDVEIAYPHTEVIYREKD